MPRSSSRPTVATIARDLGISPATVSYALNGKPGVSERLRAKIVAHAQEIGWTPHAGAQALRRGLSGNIGLVLTRDPRELAREPFYSSVTAGIESATSARGYELMVRFATGGPEQQLEVLHDWCDRRRVDGVVLMDITTTDRRPALLSERSMPFAVIGDHDALPDGPAGEVAHVQVMTDEPADAATLVQHVRDCGYDGVLQLTGSLAHRHEQRRLALVQRLCAEHGIPHGFAEADYTIDAGQRAFGQLEHDLSARPAVMAASDLIAIGALRGAERAGIAIPSEMGLLSWDDSLIAEISSPGLTALSRRPFEMGQRAGALLVGLLRGEPPVDEPAAIAPSPLVVRTSTARA
ncbi:LacI family DNA-binding transcriptional regulator [Brachybacterium sp. DNPG3]